MSDPTPILLRYTDTSSSNTTHNAPTFKTYNFHSFVPRKSFGPLSTEWIPVQEHLHMHHGSESSHHSQPP